MEQIIEVFNIDFALVALLASLFGGYIMVVLQGLKVLEVVAEGSEPKWALALSGALTALGVLAYVMPEAGPYISIGLGLLSSGVVGALGYEAFGKSLFEKLGLS